MKNNTDTRAIDVGIEYNSDVRDENADVFGYVDDGEHAVVWAVAEHEESYHVNVYNCEAGLVDNVHSMTVGRDEAETAEDLAEALAADDPEGSIVEARTYFGQA